MKGGEPELCSSHANLGDSVVVVCLVWEMLDSVGWGRAPSCRSFCGPVSEKSKRDRILKEDCSSFVFAGLPPSGSWQDLKDHMREAGDVCFTDVFKDGTGIVEFLKYDDMKYALRKLDDSKFRSHEVSAWEMY